MDSDENGHSNYYYNDASAASTSNYHGYTNYQYENPYLTTPPPLVAHLKSEDELFVDAWLSTITFKPNTFTKPVPAKIKTPTICAVKSALKKYLEVMEKLEDTHRVLKENVASLSSEDWKKRTIEIGALRDELSALITQFQSQDLLKALKQKIERRARRRLNQREHRKCAKEKKIVDQKELAATHERIDRWLENMRETVDRAKAEENMKKDADCVLSEVTKKKSDARKQLSLIAALVRLREVRESAALHRGEKVCKENQTAFNKAALKLTEMWENSLKTYSKEEQGLKIMLEQNTSNDVKVSISKEKQTSQAWEHVLFGENYIPSTPIFWGLTSAERDLESFIAIRKSWDTFLSTNGEGSKIPMGWVLPNGKANECWTKYLQT